MSQIFHPSTNVIAKVSIFGAVFFIAALLGIYGAVIRSPYVTGVGVVRPQPVPFSHEHHVSGLGLDCRYCHTDVETSSFAGIPPIHTCMTCHSQVWTDAPVLAPIRESYASEVPIQWTRVHDLPDFVHFNHSIHVHKGIGCETCHGRVDTMPLTWRTETLHMEWCLDCHRAPEEHLRPQEAIFVMGYLPPEDPAFADQLMQEYGIEKELLTDCSICHY